MTDPAATLDEIRSLLGYGRGVSAGELVEAVRALQRQAEGAEEFVPIKREVLELTGRMRREIRGATLEDAADALDDVLSGRSIKGAFAP
jgi:hypothetical protein